MADRSLPVGDFDKGGVVMDSDPFSLAPNEWSDCRNVRFDNRSVSKIAGEELMLGLDNIPASLTYWERPGDQRYVYTSTDGRSFLKLPTGSEVEITKGAAATRDFLDTSNSLTASLFNGGATYIINDGTQTPQFINAPGVGVTNTQELSDLPGWLRTGFTSITAATVRAYRNVLVAGNIEFTQTSNNVISAPSTVRVSNLAARGQLPTWDATYAGATSGDEFDLSTNSPIVDMIPFQDSLAIYTTDSVFNMRLTGSTTLPVSVQQSNSGRGMLAPNCGVEYFGRHFIVGNEDIYLNGGGATVQSVSDGRVRDYFFNNLNNNALNVVHVVHNRKQDEIWINYPKGTSTRCNEALIWNYENNVWTIRDLNSVAASSYGGRLSTANTFATITYTATSVAEASDVAATGVGSVDINIALPRGDASSTYGGTATVTTSSWLTNLDTQNRNDSMMSAVATSLNTFLVSAAALVSTDNIWTASAPPGTNSIVFTSNLLGRDFTVPHSGNIVVSDPGDNTINFTLASTANDIVNPSDSRQFVTSDSAVQMASSAGFSAEGTFISNLGNINHTATTRGSFPTGSTIVEGIAGITYAAPTSGTTTANPITISTNIGGRLSNETGQDIDLTNARIDITFTLNSLPADGNVNPSFVVEHLTSLVGTRTPIFGGSMTANQVGVPITFSDTSISSNVVWRNGQILWVYVTETTPSDLPFDYTINSVSLSFNQTRLIKDANILTADVGTSFSGNPINAYVERKGFDIAPNATNVTKWVDSIYYLIKGNENVTISTRATEAPGRPVDFSSSTDRYLKTRTFSLDATMGDYKIDPRTNGRYYNTRVESNDANGSWDLIRYNLSFSFDDGR